MRLQLRQFEIGPGAEVHLDRMIRRGPRDAVDAAVAAVPFFLGGIVAVLLVAPVDDIDRAIRAGLQIDGDVARVRREHQVAARVHRLVAGALPHVELMVHLMAVQIVREEVIAVDVRPVVALIDQGADVRVAAIHGRGARLARAAFAAVVAARRQAGSFCRSGAKSGAVAEMNGA